MCCSGVGVVPKKSGKLRLIHHLSVPAGVSVNDGIPKDLYSLRYVTIDDAINMILRLGRGTLLAKIDIRNAFHLCPVRPEDQPLLGIYWRQQYYYDLVLPFGLCSAPFILNQVTDAFEWICREEFGISDLLHLLDNFLTAGPPASDICSRRLEIVLAACTSLWQKRKPRPRLHPLITFLGIHLDTDLLEARLPDDKLVELRDLLVMFSGLPSCTKRDLLSLLGKLNVAASVVVASRTFMRHLWDAPLPYPSYTTALLSASLAAPIWRGGTTSWTLGMGGRSSSSQAGRQPLTCTSLPMPP